MRDEGDRDLLVVGGGITGAAVARDAALRGLRVALVEQHDLACGTSSRSSRLLHGGLRYLESLEISLVREGLVERRHLLDSAPGLACAVPFLYPVYDGDPEPLWRIHLGTLAYDTLAGRYGLGRRVLLPPAEIRDIEPTLRRDGLHGAILYRDGSTHDARLTLAVARSAADAGALIVTRVEVVGLRRDGDGRVIGVEAVDRVGNGRPFQLGTRTVALCTGPWQELHADIPPIIRTARGTHIAIPRERLPVRHFLALTAPGDGRLTFALPHGRYTVLGTTDDDDPAAPAEVLPLPGDVDYLLATTRHAFPEASLTRDDVRGIWAGQRPLIADPEHGDPDDLSRRHQVVHPGPGLWILAGGKLTSHRRMAEDLLDALVDDELAGEAGPCRTAEGPLVPGNIEHGRRILQERGLPQPTIEELVGLYGSRIETLAARLEDPDDLLAGQIALAVEQEWSLTLDDLLLRRLAPGSLDLYACLESAPQAAEMLGERLGWTTDERAEQLGAFRRGVEADLASAGLSRKA